MTRYGIVVALEDRGENGLFASLDVVDFLDICGFKVG